MKLHDRIFITVCFAVLLACGEADEDTTIVARISHMG